MLNVLYAKLILNFLLLYRNKSFTYFYAENFWEWKRLRFEKRAKSESVSILKENLCDVSNKKHEKMQKQITVDVLDGKADNNFRKLKSMS